MSKDPTSELTGRDAPAGKYGHLRDRLAESAASVVTLSHADLESLVGELPASALRHRAWWSNNPTRHVQAKAWLSAGYRTADVGPDSVTFVRALPDTVMTGQQNTGEGAGGDSAEQRNAEQYLVGQLSSALGHALTKRRHRIDRAVIEFDAFSDDPPVLCEAWAHLGPPKAAQKHKVMTDVLKMVWAAPRIFGDRQPAMILIFSDEVAAAHFTGRSWMAEALRGLKVDIHIFELPADLRDAVLRAQSRQYR